MEDFPEAGKIQNNFFKSRVFPYLGKTRSDVIVGPEYGVDVSIIKLANGLAMAMTSDPLSLIPTLGLRESAWISVQLMANDMATTGTAPMYAQFVLNLPTTMSADDFEKYWKYIHEYCERLGVSITGGHTGRFEGLMSTVSGGGTMISVAPGEDMITSKGAQIGDMVILTKECAMLSTAILALSFPETVKKNCGLEIYRDGCELFFKTSTVEAGLIAGELARNSKGVTAMHDVTEGGVLGALYELAQASMCGLWIDETKLPVGEAQREIGKLFSIDPRYCVGAGSMIITAKPVITDLLISRLNEQGIKATSIGKIVAPEQGIILNSEQGQKSLNYQPIDPYWEAFFLAINQGWN